MPPKIKEDAPNPPQELYGAFVTFSVAEVALELVCHETLVCYYGGTLAASESLLLSAAGLITTCNNCRSVQT
jgi:hypothetical protein